MDDKQFGDSELAMEKIQGSKAVLYTRNKTPLLINADSKSNYFYPTIYLLFQMPDIVPLKVFLKGGVEQYIFNGADLMWPGIRSISNENFKMYDIAVIFAENML